MSGSSVQYDLSPSSSHVVPVSQTKLEDFQQRMSVKIRLVNTTNAVVNGITVWACYEQLPSGGTPGTKHVLLFNNYLNPTEAIAIEAGPFNFTQGGSIWAQCGTANAVAVHLSKAIY